MNIRQSQEECLSALEDARFAIKLHINELMKQGLWTSDLSINRTLDQIKVECRALFNEIEK